MQIISNKKIDGLYTYPMAATNFCNDHISQKFILEQIQAKIISLQEENKPRIMQ